MSSPADRVDPFAMVFGDLAAEHFPAIRDAVGGGATLDAFLMTNATLELLQTLRPDEGLGETVDDFVAFVHAAWCFWDHGERRTVLDGERTRAVCAAAGSPAPVPVDGARYIQLAPRIIWGQLASGEHWEPLDGLFVVPVGEEIRVVGCFGLHPGRPGLSVVALEGGVPAAFVREDGTAPFAPVMPGGDRAGLHAVAAPEELLLLTWRALNHQTEG